MRYYSEMPQRTSLRFLLSLVAALLLLSVARSEAAEISHELFDAIVRTHVDANGRVAYKTLQLNSGPALQQYLSALAEVDPASLGDADRIAFWINAYNAHAINGILQGYSAEGVIARKRFFSWYEFRVAGKDRTLTQIEHEVLRAEFEEPRIHFALVCASTSCPVLRREAYSGNKLSEQLDDQAKDFLGDPKRNRFDEDGVLRISRIFEWFEEDFAKAAGSVAAYIGGYRKVADSPRIEYLEYDWTMNAQPGQRP